MADLTALEPCVASSVQSYVQPAHLPPTNTEALKAACKRHAEGLKCLKEKGKTLPAIIKRGLAEIIKSRQHHSKKYCANVNSEVSQKYLNDMKCILEKKKEAFAERDTLFANQLIEIYRRNYNDSSVELKVLCCAITSFRRVSSTSRPN